MAIKRLTAPIDSANAEETEISLKIDNGDFRVLNEIAEQWGFRKKEDVLRFALAVLYKTRNNHVYIEDHNGDPVKISPADELLVTKEKDGQADS